jgi:hypothetical protein
MGECIMTDPIDELRRVRRERQAAVAAVMAARPRVHDCDGVAVRRRLAVIADALELDAGEIDRALATRAGFFYFVQKFGQSTDYILFGNIQPLLRYSRLALARADPEPQVGPLLGPSRPARGAGRPSRRHSL